MKLWLKQTLLCLMVILLSFGVCMAVFVAYQTEKLLDLAQESGLAQSEAFCEHLATLERTEAINMTSEEAARRALIQFTFSTYAHLLQGRERSFSLVMDGVYLYNISSDRPMEQLPVTDQVIVAQRMVDSSGTPLLITARNTSLLGLPITVYLVEDISDTMAHIDVLTGSAQLALLACLLVCGVLLALTLRRTLHPLRTLAQVSEQIAGGQYALRSRLQTPDEVGDLSRSFDHMAETVEQKILALEDTARRRELLLGALTHEMKTPMTAIIGYSDSLLTMPLPEEERMQAASEIHQAALRTERLSQKMMQLIAMTDCPVLVRRPLDVKELLDTVRLSVQGSLGEKGLTLETHGETGVISGDSDLLFSLLTNLIDNAAKASRPGQCIRLTVQEDAESFRVCVADQGCGIPADKLALVTEPFYRVDKARSRKLGGAGLGLSLCQLIATAHGGTLDIQSREGRGTAIAMCWPKEEKP